MVFRGGGAEWKVGLQRGVGSGFEPGLLETWKDQTSSQSCATSEQGALGLKH